MYFSQPKDDGNATRKDEMERVGKSKNSKKNSKKELINIDDDDGDVDFVIDDDDDFEKSIQELDSIKNEAG